MDQRKKSVIDELSSPISYVVCMNFHWRAAMWTFGEGSVDTNRKNEGYSETNNNGASGS
ncbi:hypothetical protein OIV19_23060 [Brucella sp. HL-2]|nr:hypothetical protein [Brucella sp. HL-2]MCV9910451.1 hypothetical protein [Brucella sp. HL-2]